MSRLIHPGVRGCFTELAAANLSIVGIQTFAFGLSTVAIAFWVNFSKNLISPGNHPSAPDEQLGSLVSCRAVV